jgi:hypothetical protein
LGNQSTLVSEAGYRFDALYDKVSREDILAHAYAQCRSNKGAAGVDGPGLYGYRHDKDANTIGCLIPSDTRDAGFCTLVSFAQIGARRDFA